METKKVLYLGVRNKYCCVCARASSKNKQAEDHKCYKNWDGSSSGMESDILVEGFNKSIDMYGVKYARFIGDGDSNVYKKILDSRPYDNLTVEKIECKNHLLRNACNKLKQIVTCRKNGYISLRKLIENKIRRLRAAVTEAVKHRKNEGITRNEKLVALRNDILNAPYHVFGSHDHCASYFCDGTKIEKNFVPQLQSSGLFTKIMDVFNSLADNTKSLLYDYSNNTVEQFNSIIAKFTGGKRINFCQKRGYQTRCSAAVVSHNNHMPYYTLHRNMFSCSPGVFSKRLEQRREKIRKQNKDRQKTFRRRRLFPTIRNESSYGDVSEKPDLPDELFQEKKRNFISSLNLTKEKKDDILKNTFLQHLSQMWIEERRKRLTASNFGAICNKLPYTKCDSIIKSLLYNNIDTQAMKYGRIHEKDAINELKSLDIIVQPCGLFIDDEFNFLGATPDGLLNDNGIVEIKCPASCSEMTPDDAIFSRKFTFWKIDNTKKQILGVNTKHKYYFQVQGQLKISNRQFCLFVLWTPQGIKMEKIVRDSEFWKTNMEEKLINFYFECLLPELIDPRYTRSLPIRNPDSIMEAINKKKKSKGKKIVSIKYSINYVLFIIYINVYVCKYVYSG